MRYGLWVSRSTFCVLRSVFCVLCSALRVQCYVFRVQCSVFCVPRYVFCVLGTELIWHKLMKYTCQFDIYYLHFTLKFKLANVLTSGIVGSIGRGEVNPTVYI